jgi:hypothetical protein
VRFLAAGLAALFALLFLANLVVIFLAPDKAPFIVQVPILALLSLVFAAFGRWLKRQA